MLESEVQVGAATGDPRGLSDRRLAPAGGKPQLCSESSARAAPPITVVYTQCWQRADLFSCSHSPSLL